MKPKILDELLKEIRRRGAYEVSRTSGIPKTTIESWLYGKAIPSLVKAARVADAMGLELLLFEKEN
ncbi:helix-turn-helix domain-containing protein [Anaerocaecibacter muris]|uniref:helix-turn-helix domain-containing protein n=1 Tax=Anaerocaecibacter muris TaxID=2941513 RepID=UPI0020422C01|nr:helix-turn-helix transcriptional regulator [Anaerocaecibacter muris]